MPDDRVVRILVAEDNKVNQRLLDALLGRYLLVIGAPRSECRVSTWGSMPCLRQGHVPKPHLCESLRLGKASLARG